MMPWFRAMLYFWALCGLHTEMSNLAKSSNGQNIARIALISTIFCQNRPRRPDLNFEKKLRAVLVAVVVVVVVESDGSISGAITLEIRHHSHLSPSMEYVVCQMVKLQTRRS